MEKTGEHDKPIVYLGPLGEVFSKGYKLLGFVKTGGDSGGDDEAPDNHQTGFVVSKVQDLISVLKSRPIESSYQFFEEYRARLRIWEGNASKILTFIRPPQYIFHPVNPDEEQPDKDFSALIPAQPLPANYSTYESFKQALKRWAKYCSSLTSIPPHVSDLRHLAGLEQGDAFDPGRRKTVHQHNETAVIRTLELEEDASAAPVPNPQPSQAQTEASSGKGLVTEYAHTVGSIRPYAGNAWYSLDPHIQAEIRRTISSLLWRGLKYREGHDTLVPPPRARLHGTFPHSAFPCWIGLSGDAEEEERENRGGGRLKRERREKGNGDAGTYQDGPYGARGGLRYVNRGGNKSVLRFNHETRVSGSGLAHAAAEKDAPPSVDGRPLLFVLPDICEPEHISLSKLAGTTTKGHADKGESEYGARIAKELASIDHAALFDECQSWYQPTVPAAAHEQHRQKIMSVLMRGQLNSTTLRRILLEDQFFDKFCAMLTQEWKSGGAAARSSSPSEASPPRSSSGGSLQKSPVALSVFDMLAAGISTWRDLASLVGLFNDTALVSVKAKLSVFTFRLLTCQGSFGAHVLEGYLTQGSLEQIELLLIVLSLFHGPVRKQQFDPRWRDLISQTLNATVADLCLTTFRMSLLTGISRCFSRYEKEIQALPLSAVGFGGKLASAAGLGPAQSLVQSLSGGLCNECIAHTDLEVARLLLRGAAHRNPTIALPCNQSLGWALSRRESSVLHALKRSTTGLVAAMLAMVRARPEHTRLAGVALFQRAVKTQWLGEFAVGSIASSSAALIGYLTGPSDMLRDNVLALLRHITATAGRTGDRQGVRFMIAHGMFALLLQEVGEKGILHPDDEGTREAHDALSGLQQASLTIGVDSVRGRSVCALASLLAAWTLCAYRLGVIEATSEASATHSAHGGQGAATRVYVTKQQTLKLFDLCVEVKLDPGKQYLVRALRHLLKTSSVFMDVRRDPTFFQRIQDLCRDGSDLQANREAWRLFFQLVRYHPDTIDFLVRHNYLGPVLNMCSISSTHIIIGHALHYVNKIFKLAENEDKRQQLGRATVPAETRRTFPRGVRSLNDFFVNRHLYIKLHMIYKRYGKDTSGCVFQKLAQIMRTIGTSAECERVLADAARNPEYLQGINGVMGMFLSNDD